MGKKKDTETIINEIKNIHGDKYDTSKVNYVNSKTKICLICHEKNILGEEHGEFWVVPSKITTRHDGCPKCSGHYQTTEEYIAKAELVHGNKYDHSKTVYEGSHKKLTVICPKHGEFQIIAKDHLNGQGCPKCKFEKIGDLKRDTQDSFLKKYYDKFKNDTIYDTSKVEYKKSNIKICLICHEKNILGEEHGEFWMAPNDLLSGGKCPKCYGRYQTTEEFIAKSRLIHEDKYIYSKTVYVNARTKVCIICPEHGEFWQLPYAHLCGQGCPKCVMSHLENKIKRLLENNNIRYIYECNINDILKRKNVDFYLPEYNIAIECQGGQHFYGGFNRNNIEKANEIHNKVLKRDIEKFKILKEYNIEILYYTDINDLPNDIFTNKKYNGIYNENNFFTNIELLKQKIRKDY